MRSEQLSSRLIAHAAAPRPPRFRDDEGYTRLWGDLMGYDAHIAGLLMAVSSGRAPKGSMTPDDALEQRIVALLEQRDGEIAEGLREVLRYKQQLDGLLRDALTLLAQQPAG